MTKARVENMMDKMIKKHGFEDARTIEFCQVAEDYLMNKRPFEDVEEAFWVNYR